jgi:hypothetical protein
MKHKTITLILSALLDIEDFRFTSSFKHKYIAISFFRSSLFHTYYSQLYSKLCSPLTLFSLWTRLSDAFPHLVQWVLLQSGPKVGHHLPWTAWICCVSLTKSDREWEIRCTQTYRHTTEKQGIGRLYIPDGKHECLLEPEGLFY